MKKHNFIELINEGNSGWVSNNASLKKELIKKIKTLKKGNKFIINAPKQKGEGLNKKLEFIKWNNFTEWIVCKDEDEKILKVSVENLTDDPKDIKKLKEAKSGYEVYNDKYGRAIDEVERYAKKKGYTLNETEFSDAFMDAFFKPKKGKTKSDHLTLYKNGKQQKKKLHSQIYNRGTDGNTFELNMYIA